MLARSSSSSGRGASSGEPQVDPLLLNRARRGAHKAYMIAAGLIKSGDDMQTFIMNNKEAWLVKDRSAKVELPVLLHLNGKPGGALLDPIYWRTSRARRHQASPTPALVTDGVRKVGRSGLWEFLDADSHALFNEVMEVPASTPEGKNLMTGAVMKGEDEDFMMNVVDRCKYFLWGCNMKGEAVYGAEYLKVLFDKIAERAGPGDMTNETKDMMDKFHVYSHLATAGRKSRLGRSSGCRT